MNLVARFVFATIDQWDSLWCTLHCSVINNPYLIHTLNIRILIAVVSFAWDIWNESVIHKHFTSSALLLFSISTPIFKALPDAAAFSFLLSLFPFLILHERFICEPSSLAEKRLLKSMDVCQSGPLYLSAGGSSEPPQHAGLLTTTTYGSKLTNKATKQDARYCSNISVQRNLDDPISKKPRRHCTLINIANTAAATATASSRPISLLGAPHFKHTLYLCKLMKSLPREKNCRKIFS